MPLRGIRGATTAEKNDAASIGDATETLLTTMITTNHINAEDIASIFFSATNDLNAEFPAVVARKIGLTVTPLLCVKEIDVPKGLKRCIRILMHVNTTQSQDQMTPVYLKNAVSLRPDFSEKHS
jgi:chorismate mutase